MPRARIAAIALVLLLVTVLAGPSPGRRADAGSPAASFEEVGALIPREDGTWVQYTALIDPNLTDAETVLSAYAPGAGDSSSVTAAYTLWRKWAPQDIPVGVAYNPDFDPPGLSARQALLDAIGQWNAVPGSSFRFVAVPDTHLYAPRDQCPLQKQDGVNSIRFNNEFPKGMLGSTCAVVAGDWDGQMRVIEFDFELSGTAAWVDTPTTPTGYYDLHSTTLHELGHALGLHHSNEEGAVMRASLPTGLQRRTLTPDDVAGVLALYGPGGPGPLGYRRYTGMLAADSASTNPFPATSLDPR